MLEAEERERETIVFIIPEHGRAVLSFSLFPPFLIIDLHKEGSPLNSGRIDNNRESNKTDGNKSQKLIYTASPTRLGFRCFPVVRRHPH